MTRIRRGGLYLTISALAAFFLAFLLFGVAVPNGTVPNGIVLKGASLTSHFARRIAPRQFAALVFDIDIDDMAVNTALDEAGFTGIISERTSFFYLDNFASLEKIPLADLDARLDVLDPRRDGYADKLRAFFRNGDKKRIFVSMENARRLRIRTLKELSARCAAVFADAGLSAPEVFLGMAAADTETSGLSGEKPPAAAQNGTDSIGGIFPSLALLFLLVPVFYIVMERGGVFGRRHFKLGGASHIPFDPVPIVRKPTRRRGRPQKKLPYLCSCALSAFFFILTLIFPARQIPEADIPSVMPYTFGDLANEDDYREHLEYQASFSYSVLGDRKSPRVPSTLDKRRDADLYASGYVRFALDDDGLYISLDKISPPSPPDEPYPFSALAAALTDGPPRKPPVNSK
jgi:hypothetical protein